MFSDHLLMLNVELEERECLSARKGGHHSLFHHYRTNHCIDLFDVLYLLFSVLYSYSYFMNLRLLLVLLR